MWRQGLNYCFRCRQKYQAGEKQGEPLCDRTSNQKCELIPSWQDSDGKIRHDPIHLMPENYLAVEIYELIASLSPLRPIQKRKGKDIFTVYHHDMSAMASVLAAYHLAGDEKQIVLKKIAMMYNISLREKMAGV